MTCFDCNGPAPVVATAPEGRYARRVYKGVAICHACFNTRMAATPKGTIPVVEAQFDAAVEAHLTS